MYTHCFRIILIERFRITFTSNGKIEFAPCDQLSLQCCLLSIFCPLSLHKIQYAIFIHQNCSELFIFYIQRNSQLESAVLGVTQNLSIIQYLRKFGDNQTALINDSFFFFSEKIYMLFCSLTDVGQIVSRNMMLNLSVLCVIWRIFFLFSS